MKNKTYTVKFFKDLINQNSTYVSVEKSSREDESQQSRESENFFTTLFSTAS